MPSLHAAFALLITIYFWRMVPPAVRPLLAAYPVAMAFALVYTGEHYVTDCVVGWIYTVVAYWGVNRLADRRAQRRLASTPARRPVIADGRAGEARTS